MALELNFNMPSLSKHRNKFDNIDTKPFDANASDVTFVNALNFFYLFFDYYCYHRYESQVTMMLACVMLTHIHLHSLIMMMKVF